VLAVGLLFCEEVRCNASFTIVSAFSSLRAPASFLNKGGFSACSFWECLKKRVTKVPEVWARCSADGGRLEWRAMNVGR
jgi:hypothetical protein